MNFNKNRVVIGMGALVLYVLMVDQINRFYISAGLVILAAYIYYSIADLGVIISDPRERYEAARLKSGGRNRIPRWDVIQGDDLQIEKYKNLFFYIYFFEGERWGLALEPDGTINKRIPPQVSPLAMSDVRNFIFNEAYGREERDSLENALDTVRKAGFAVRTRKFKDVEEEEK